MSGSTSHALRTVLTRMAVDAQFAEQIRRDPTELVGRYGLTADEAATVCGAKIDMVATRPGRLEERLSRSVIFPGVDLLATADPDVAADHSDTAYKSPVVTSGEAVKVILANPNGVSPSCVDAAPATDLASRSITADTVVVIDGLPGGGHISVQSNPDGSWDVDWDSPAVPNPNITKTPPGEPRLSISEPVRDLFPRP